MAEAKHMRDAEGPERQEAAPEEPVATASEPTRPGSEGPRRHDDGAGRGRGKRTRDIVFHVVAIVVLTVGALMLAWPLILDLSAQDAMDQEIDQVRQMRSIVQDGGGEGDDDTSSTGGAGAADASSDDGATDADADEDGATTTTTTTTTTVTTDVASNTSPTRASLLEAWDYLDQYNQDVREGRITSINDPWGFGSGSGGFLSSELPGGLVGELVIPTMSVDVPLYLGSTAAHMSRGATVMYGTSAPLGQTDSNCVIAAHRAPASSGWMFSYIERLRVGDLVYVHTPWDDLTYQVSGFSVVDPDDTSAVGVQAGRDLVTLLTCHPYPENTYRLLVFCERVGVSQTTTQETTEGGAPSSSGSGASAATGESTENPTATTSDATQASGTQDGVPKAEGEQTILGMDLLDFQDRAIKVGLVVTGVLLVVEVVRLVQAVLRRE